MVEKPRQDSSRDLLEELEEGWTPAAPPAAPLATKAAPGVVPAAPGSNPDLSEVDEGWLDDLFGDEEEEDDDEPEEAEPELPDERLDPEAFALAKKAREERAAARKEKKRVKAEAKRARQKARAAASRQKQKGKKNRPPPSSRNVAPSRRDREREARRPRTAEDTSPAPADEAASEIDAEDLAAAGIPAAKPRSRPGAAARRPNTMASIKLLAIVLAVLLALGAAAAVIFK